MKIRKIILCITAGLTAFGAGVGLFELGRWLTVEPVDEYCQIVNTAPTGVKQVEPILTSKNLPLFAAVSPTPLAPVELPETKPADDGADDDDYEFRSSGVFYIIGELPKGFRDFKSMSYWTTDSTLASAENNYREAHIAPEGIIETSREYEFTRVAVTPKRLKFETETIKGISYKFSGNFVEETIDMGEYIARVSLEGTLTKMRDGKKVAEIKVKLEEGGC